MQPEPYVIAGKIRAALREILDHYDAAGNPPKITDDSEPSNGGDPARPPTDVHAIDVRVEAHNGMAYWCQFILDEVNDGTIETKVRGSDLHDIARFIDTWALALAEQHPDSASGHHEACKEQMTKWGRQLRVVAHGTRTRSIEVGPCPEVILDDQAETFRRCDGTIVAVLTDRDPDSDGLLPKHLTCDVDSAHTWSPWQWHDVGKRIESMRAG